MRRQQTASVGAEYVWEAEFLVPLAQGRRPAGKNSEFFHEDVEVYDTKACGRGLRSKSTLAPGDLVMVEEAVYTCSGFDEIRSLGAVPGIGPKAREAWQSLSRTQKVLTASLAHHPEEPPPPVGGSVPLADWGQGPVPQLRSGAWFAGIMCLNAMSMAKLVEKPDGLMQIEASSGENGIGLFARCGLVNHSCMPNTTRTPFPGWQVLRSARHVLAGCELTTTYIDVRKPHFVRRQQLRDVWGIDCRCDRCALEDEVWSDATQCQHVKERWDAFQHMVSSGRCEDRDLAKLVESMKLLTEQALERFLSRSQASSRTSGALSEDLQPALDLTRVQRAALWAGKQADESFDPAAVCAYRRLRNILLESTWVAPALEYALGLWFSGRASQSADILAGIVAATREVTPLSSPLVSNMLQRAICAAHAGQSEVQVRALLADALRTVQDAFGGDVSFLKTLGARHLAPELGLPVLITAARRLGERATLTKGAADGAAGQSATSAAAAAKAAAHPPSAAPTDNAGVAGPPLKRGGQEEACFQQEQIDEEGSGSGSTVHLRVEGVGSDATLVATVPHVDDRNAVVVDVSEESLRVNGQEVLLPRRIEADTAQVRWSRKRRSLTIMAHLAVSV